MGKHSVSSGSIKPGDLSRSRRRASQTKHRQQVASCYQRLRKCIPKAPKKSSDTKRRVLNKVDILNQSKEYILHLEKVLQNLIDKKKTTTNDCQKFDSMVARTIKNFDCIEAFRAHFGIRFEPQAEISVYFDESKTVQLEKRMSTRRSSQYSEDLGFVSGEGSSQERYWSGSSRQSSQETNSVSGHLIHPYMQRAAYASNYPYPYGIYPNHSYFNGSHVLYYVPPVGYPTPYYIPCENISQSAQGSQSAKKQDATYTPAFSPFVVPRAVKSNLIKKTTQENEAAEPSPCGNLRSQAAESSTTSVPRLEMRYSYSTPDGKMSPPRICARGQCGNSSSSMLLVVENAAGKGEERNGEYYSRLVPNS